MRHAELTWLRANHVKLYINAHGYETGVRSYVQEPHVSLRCLRFLWVRTEEVLDLGLIAMFRPPSRQSDFH